MTQPDIEYLLSYKIGKAVKQIRVGTGMTQGELASVIKTSQRRVSEIENGKTELTVREFFYLLELADPSIQNALYFFLRKVD